MKTAFGPRVEQSVRNCTPVFLTLALVFIGLAPFPAPGYVQVTPMLTLVSVYYWSIYRPDLLPLAATFCIGLMQDVLTGTPLGMSALVLLLVQGAVVAQRRFFLGKTFVVVWCCFMLVAPAAAVVSWLLASLYHWTIMEPRLLLFQHVVTILIYPCLTWFFAVAHKRLVAKA